MLDGGACFNLATILALPVRHRAMLSLDVSLTEYVVKDILQVVHLVVLVLELNELSSGRVRRTRILVISQPKFVAVHGDSGYDGKRVESMESDGQRS